MSKKGSAERSQTQIIILYTTVVLTFWPTVSEILSVVLCCPVLDLASFLNGKSMDTSKHDFFVMTWQSTAASNPAMRDATTMHRGTMMRRQPGKWMQDLLEDITAAATP